jgi:hypothetical protein
MSNFDRFTVELGPLGYLVVDSFTQRAVKCEGDPALLAWNEQNSAYRTRRQAEQHADRINRLNQWAYDVTDRRAS